MPEFARRIHRIVLVGFAVGLFPFLLFKIPSQFAQSPVSSGKALWVATLAQLLKLNPDDGSAVGQAKIGEAGSGGASGPFTSDFLFALI